jgi:hypothetical protein
MFEKFLVRHNGCHNFGGEKNEEKKFIKMIRFMQRFEIE